MAFTLFPESKILIDNYHLIQRYGDTNHPKSPEAVMRQKLLMKKISGQVTSKCNLLKSAEDGLQLFNNISGIIEKFNDKEKSEGISPSNKIVNDKLLRVHNNQKRHFENCLAFPAGIPHVIYDRFGREYQTRGSHKLEQIWRQLKAIFPEKCSASFGEALLCAAITDHNFCREIQFSKNWEFMPIPIRYLATTQRILLSIPSAIKDHLGLLSLFSRLSLGEDDQNIFGLTKAFEDALPKRVEIPSRMVYQLSNSFTNMINFSSIRDDEFIEEAIETMLVQTFNPDEAINDNILSTSATKRRREFAPMSHDTCENQSNINDMKLFKL